MKTWIAGALAALTATGASALTLDFSGTNGSITGSHDVPGVATITHENKGDILIGAGAAGRDDGFCFLGINCQAGGSIVFDFAVTGLTFDIDGSQSGDSVDISAYRDGALLSTMTYNTGNQAVTDFAALTLDTLIFVDNSTAAGVGYSTFDFEQATGGNTAVPLPASALLLLGGMGALGMARRRQS